MKLKATKREIVGKKVKKLRQEGLIPASVYGPSYDSTSITLDAKEFHKTFQSRGYSRFIQLELDGGKPVRVLVKNVNIHPLKDNYVEVSLYAVDEGKKIQVDVPVEISGESPAVKQNLGFLVQPLDSVALYCLPKDLPESIEINIDVLKEIGDSIIIKDVEFADGVDLASHIEENSAIVFIAAPQKEIVEEEPEVAEGEEGEEGEDGEGEEGEEKEGGEKEEKKSEE